MRRAVAIFALLALASTAHAWGGSALGGGSWRGSGGGYATYGGSSRVGGHDTPRATGHDDRKSTGGQRLHDQAQGPTTGRADTFNGTNRSTMGYNLGSASRVYAMEPAAGPDPAKYPDRWIRRP